MTYTYRVIIEPDEDVFHAYAPALPGCHTWGATIDEARMMIRDAIDVYVRSLVADGETVPQDAGIEVLETFESPNTNSTPAYA